MEPLWPYRPDLLPEPLTSDRVQAELQRVANALAVRDIAVFTPQQALPLETTDGMLAYFAAGVAGPAAGFYGYEAGAWVKL